MSNDIPYHHQQILFIHDKIRLSKTDPLAQNERSQIPYDEKIKGSMVDEEFYREFSAGRSELEKRIDE
ncbi:hypothetical protein G9A89_003959, partial [Geosiphon pyriformis]